MCVQWHHNTHMELRRQLLIPYPSREQPLIASLGSKHPYPPSLLISPNFHFEIEFCVPNDLLLHHSESEYSFYVK